MQMNPFALSRVDRVLQFFFVFLHQRWLHEVKIARKISIADAIKVTDTYKLKKVGVFFSG